ncbi:MAG: hypothetical protein AB7I32_09855 [Gammaproteobacteria bacterium]
MRPILLMALALLGWTTAAIAEERFQAIPIDSGTEFGTEKALIIDTLAGHMWIWTESPATDEEPGGRYVIYQGQLTPGSTMGEVVMKQEWPVTKPTQIKVK